MAERTKAYGLGSDPQPARAWFSRSGVQPRASNGGGHSRPASQSHGVPGASVSVRSKAAIAVPSAWCRRWCLTYRTTSFSSLPSKERTPYSCCQANWLCEASEWLTKWELLPLTSPMNVARAILGALTRPNGYGSRCRLPHTRMPRDPWPSLRSRCAGPVPKPARSAARRRGS